MVSQITGGHKRSVRSVAWKPRGAGDGIGKGGKSAESTLATGSFDASVGVWKRWDDWGKGGGEGFGISNGEEAISGRDEHDDDEDGEEKEEEEEEWRFALVLDGHDSEVKSVSWSAGGQFLATCSRDKSVWIWEEVGEDDFETIAVLQEHEGDVKCVSWHPEEELLASGSYDDEVRLWREDVDDWGCVAVLRGHESTVWAVDWEGLEVGVHDAVTAAGTPISTEEGAINDENSIQQQQQTQKQDWLTRRQKSGPRLATCSDDTTIRIWRRQPRDQKTNPQQSKLSIIKTGTNEEDWIEEARLPKAHERAIYSVAWSKKSGRIASTSGDGRIVVYEERWRDGDASITADKNNDDEGEGEDKNKSEEGTLPDADPPPTSSFFPHTTTTTTNGAAEKAKAKAIPPIPPITPTPTLPKAQDQEDQEQDQEEPTTWQIIAIKDAAHDAFEINHVCFARRADRGMKKNSRHGVGRDRENGDRNGGDKENEDKDDEKEEEIIISTGDDGIVRVWTLNACGELVNSKEW